MTIEFIVIGGGCAVNAAIAVARLGGARALRRPARRQERRREQPLMADMAREGIDTSGVVRVAGATAPVSGIMVDAAGETDDRHPPRRRDRDRAPPTPDGW